MNSQVLHNLFETFHDFDLVELDQSGFDLSIKFKCDWNEMNVEREPRMTFKFIFKDCEIIEFEYFVFIGAKNDHDKEEVETFKIKDYKKIVEADIYFNRFEKIDDQYWFYCIGNQETNDIGGGTVKFKFNTDQFKIFDFNNQELKIDEYHKLCNDWWSFLYNQHRNRTITKNK
jgi:hypothetical protein